MHDDIADALTIELKKDIADRYFGFRKLIEEDKQALGEQIREQAVILEKRISFDLIRMYILLKDEALIQRFLELIGLAERMFYDPYLTESPTIRARVFKGLRVRGLTRKSCFTNAAFDCYERLEEHVGLYRERFAALVAEREVISEEIRLFYRNNDLGAIIGFMRSLGEPVFGSDLQGGMETNLAADLEKKLRIPPPSPVEQFLPPLPPLPPLPTIRKQLAALVNEAFTLHQDDIHAYVNRRSSLFYHIG